jgi:hypothetical protein
MRSRPPFALAALVAGVLVLAGCGGGDAADEPLPGTVPVEGSDQPGASPRPFQTVEFDPPISFQLPAGWRAEEEFGVIQAFRGEGERWVLTIESDPAGGDAEARVEQMRGSLGLLAEEPEPATVGGHDAQVFEAEADLDTPLDGTEYFVIRYSFLRAWVVDVDGTLVMIFAEAGSLRRDQRDEEADSAFFNETQQILDSLEFAAAP